MNTNDKAAMTARYRARLNRLARVLYDSDPLLMGSLIGTPEDEYVPIAARLMPLLSRAAGREACARILAEHNMHDDQLVGDVWNIFTEQQS